MGTNLVRVATPIAAKAASRWRCMGRTPRLSPRTPGWNNAARRRFAPTNGSLCARGAYVPVPCDRSIIAGFTANCKGVNKK